MSGRVPPAAPPAAPPATLGTEDLRRLCDFLYRRTGMAYGEGKRYYVERRVAQRIERSGAGDFPAYMALLRADGAEAARLVNSFTVNETYFWREEHQLRCLSRSVLPEVVARKGPGDLVRLWSVPCSSGEEPYSIAIWLLENWALVDAYNVEIVGSDIDGDALAAALAGGYGARAVSRLPPALLGRYFEPEGEGRFRLIGDIRESVRFTAANLMDAAGMAAHGRFDAVFCRNVLIYFDAASRRVAAGHLVEALAPGGFLLLGHTESMTRLSDRLEARRFEDAVVYQRPPA